MQPVDKPLYDSIKKKYASMKHSAYKSGLIVKQYKKAFREKHGDKKPYRGKKTQKGLTRWFKEDWRNQRGEVGYKKKGDIYRPTKRITKDTPKTLSELKPSEIERAKKEKAAKGRAAFSDIYLR